MLQELINNVLWDDARGIYSNRHWDGEFATEISPTSFYPMIAEIPNKKQAKKLVASLTDENLFWGKYVLPSIAKNSRYYAPDGDYWRGRIWPPINYLLYEGLKNYDKKVAELFRQKCKDLLLGEWRTEQHIHENYSCLTGKGEPQADTYARSCPMYTWGALLALISTQL